MQEDSKDGELAFKYITGTSAKAVIGMSGIGKPGNWCRVLADEDLNDIALAFEYINWKFADSDARTLAIHTA